MRAILVDPKRQAVQRLYDDFTNSLIVFHYLGTTVTTQITLGPTHTGILDEFGIFRKDQNWFGLHAEPNVALAGRMLILQNPAGEDGLYRPCQMDVEAISKVIKWFDNPQEAEALVPDTQLIARGKVIGTEKVSGFRTMDKQFVNRNGQVSVYDPT
jgi:hypothetical protein